MKLPRGVVMLATAGLVAVAAAACQGPVTPTSSVFISDDFKGNLVPGGVDIYSDKTTVSGTITLALTTAGPVAGVSLEVGIGTFASDGVTCQAAVAQNLTAGQNFTVGQVPAGTYCLFVLEATPGTLTDAEAYSIRFNHH